MLVGRERGDQGDLDPRDGPLSMSLHFHGFNFHAAPLLGRECEDTSPYIVAWNGDFSTGYRGHCILVVMSYGTGTGPGWSGTYNIRLYCSTPSKT
jgi:hypothetical protein